MVYFLGRDLTVAITSEHVDCGVIVHTGTGTPTSEVLTLRTASVRDCTTGGAVGIPDLVTGDTAFAGARVGHDEYVLGTVFGNIDQSASTTFGFTKTYEVLNLTGADLSLGAMDEDLSFIGQRATMRVEVKKENSVTLTRKKSNDVWDVIYNDARFGVTTGTEHAATDYETGLSAPDNTDYGYRVYIKFKDYVGASEQGGYLVLPNCCITEHSVTLGADSTTEESMTFQSYLDPIIVRGALASGTLDGDATGF